jgi:type II secretory pathway component PulF
MPKFLYKAINERANTVSGVIEATSLEMVTDILTEKGYIPSKVIEKKEGFGSIEWSNISQKITPVKIPDLILFTKQFRTMIRAGVPILSLLQVLRDQTENLKLKKIIEAMTLDIKRGSSLYDTFGKHPGTFSPFYCSMVRAGESSGELGSVMDRLIYLLEHEHKIKSDIKSALQYPILVVIFLAVAFFVLLTFVTPKFTMVLISAGIAIPLPTRICMLLYQILSNYWYMIFGGVIAGIWILFYYFNTEQGKYVRDYCVLKLPIFGPLFVKAAMARFASIFVILHKSGIHLLDSITILSGTIGNAAITKEFERIRGWLEEGRGIAEPLRSAKHFTPMVINMIAIGEASGKLDDMLSEIAAHYDDEVEYATSQLSEVIGPILVVGLAAVVGFFALAIFLPMWDLTKIVGRG